MMWWFAIALLVVATTPYRLPPRFPVVKGNVPLSLDLVDEWDVAYEEGDASQMIRYYTENALMNMGTPSGHNALEFLSQLTNQRKSYDFSISSIEGGNKSPMIFALPQLLSPPMLEELLRQSKDMESFMNTNLDSVDSIPSMHLNLWVGGKERFASNDFDNGVREKGNKMEDLPMGYKDGVQKMSLLLKPFLRQVLLPRVRTLMNDSSIMIDEVFLRRYGDDVGRRSISAHFDSFSRVTAVIALDDVACNGTNGLYTTTSHGEAKQACNHVALRRYFPLKRGDGVVHTWDVLHGVDVESGFVRTSLIVWFISPPSTSLHLPSNNEHHKHESSNYQSSTNLWNTASTMSTCAPWVSQRPDLAANDVAQFVLASVIEVSSSINNHTDDISYELYLKSAALGNAFALDRLGWFYHEYKGELPSAQAISARSVLEELHSSSNLKVSLRLDDDENCIPSVSSLAKRFWYEGAIRGVAQSQLALAYCLMKEAAKMSGNFTVARNEGNEGQKLRLMAAVLASLAEQQGEEDAALYLADLVNQEIMARSIKTDDEFATSPVVQTISAWRSVL